LETILELNATYFTNEGESKVSTTAQPASHYQEHHKCSNYLHNHVLNFSRTILSWNLTHFDLYDKKSACIVPEVTYVFLGGMRL